MPSTFADLGVPAPIVAALTAHGITAPFPIQTATIPTGLEGRDLSGKAATGSGKTIAFGVPLVARVTRSAPKRPHGLVLVPTRELAIQVADEVEAISGDLRVLAVYGGANIEPQLKRMRAGVDIVVATPGRLMDLIERKACDLRDVDVAVVDEADRMADMGFLPDVKRLLDQTSDDRQTILFSATLDGAVDELVHRYQTDPVVHEIDEEHAGDIVHHIWVAERPGRVALLAQIVDRIGPTVVFCRTKHGTDRVAAQLEKAGVTAVAIHGNRSQAQRERALEAFHRGNVRALVATDVAARGIHVEDVAGVVHFDLPADGKDYVHRSGRTGRAGADGTVVSLIDARQRKEAVRLKKSAGIDAVIGEPDLEALPVGPRPEEVARAAREADAKRPHKRSTSASHGGGRSKDRPKGGSKGSPKGGSRDRWSTDRPAKERAAKGHSSKDGRHDERPSKDRPSRDAARSTSAPRPAGKATSGDAKAARGRDDRGSDRGKGAWDDRRDRERSGRHDGGGQLNRKERRAAQFSDEERARRAEANQRRSEADQRAALAKGRSASSRGKGADTRSSGSTGTSKHRSGAHDHDRVLPDVAGSDAKVRASGASRRKAAREASLAAGEAPGRAKKRRSGRPRPPKSVRQAERA